MKDRIEKDNLFEKNKNLIYSRSWYYSKKHRIDFEEIKSEAFLIFCEAIERYNEGWGAAFSSFLYSRLRTLDDYCTREKKYKERMIDVCIFDDPLDTDNEKFSQITSDDGEQIEKLFERLYFYDIVEELSLDGRKILEGLFRGDFDKPFSRIRCRNICMSNIKEAVVKYWGWSHPKFDRVFEEIRVWWKKNKFSFSF